MNHYTIFSETDVQFCVNAYQRTDISMYNAVLIFYKKIYPQYWIYNNERENNQGNFDDTALSIFCWPGIRIHLLDVFGVFEVG